MCSSVHCGVSALLERLSLAGGIQGGEAGGLATTSQGTFEFCQSSDAETQSNGVVSLSLSVLMGPVTGDRSAQFAI